MPACGRQNPKFANRGLTPALKISQTRCWCVRVAVLRAVTSTDGMTADFYPFDMKFLGETATRIINEVKGVNRVACDVTSKPPGRIEWVGGPDILECVGEK
jgi:hypothetical protein